MILVFLAALYGFASLLHFVHAQYLHEYPNLPAWLTRSEIYAVWLVIAATGLVGCVGARVLAAHTAAMNATIWFEVAAAGLLMTAVIARTAKYLRTGD